MGEPNAGDRIGTPGTGLHGAWDTELHCCLPVTWLMYAPHWSQWEPQSWGCLGKSYLIPEHNRENNTAWTRFPPSYEIKPQHWASSHCQAASHPPEEAEPGFLIYTPVPCHWWDFFSIFWACLCVVCRIPAWSPLFLESLVNKHQLVDQMEMQLTGIPTSKLMHGEKGSCWKTQRWPFSRIWESNRLLFLFGGGFIPPWEKLASSLVEIWSWKGHQAACNHSSFRDSYLHHGTAKASLNKAYFGKSSGNWQITHENTSGPELPF